MDSISNKKKLTGTLIAVVLLGATTNVDVINAQSDDSSSLVRTLEGHTSLVDEVAVTPDGKAISASWDKTLKVWDIESGEELRTLEGHTDAVFEVAVTQDGKAISASWDKTLKVWDIESGEELRTLEGHMELVFEVAVTPDGTKAISASADNTLKVWDIESGEELRTLEGHTRSVTGVLVTPDGTKAISASWDKTLKVWDIESGEELRTLEGHTDWVDAVAVTPDGTKAISASLDNTLKVWDIESIKTSEESGKTSGCLIATAAFGSELSPQVQFLRDFRDQKIMNTLAGSSFMQVFNAWYYSFSPYVADYEREQPWLQHTVKTSIYPLIVILQTSEKANSSIDGEYGTVAAGLLASSMIGALYFWPFAISVRRVRTSRFNYKLALSMIAFVFVGIIGSLATGNEYALMASTSLFVLTVVSVSGVLSAKLIVTVFHTAGNMKTKVASVC